MTSAWQMNPTIEKNCLVYMVWDKLLMTTAKGNKCPYMYTVINSNPVKYYQYVVHYVVPLDMDY